MENVKQIDEKQVAQKLNLDIINKKDVFNRKLLKIGLYMFFFGSFILPFYILYKVGSNPSSMDDKLDIFGYIIFSVIAIGFLLMIKYIAFSTFNNIKYIFRRK